MLGGNQGFPLKGKRRCADGLAARLPQKDPEHHTFFLKSYNRPEFMVEPVRISVDEFSKVFTD